MIKEIMKDEAFLSQPSTPATAEDLPVAQDLLDTLAANKERCVGMAANMIGAAKQIIAVDDNGSYLLLFNPQIIKHSEAFEAEEACLSLEGTRKTKRYKSIKVHYQNSDFKERLKTFKGWTAQIIQHEIDHCNGIII
ncbi:MAG: peptide deformylase [Oscillospiraceae bacterium]